MSHYHAIVWLDHVQAKVFHFTATEAERTSIRSHSPNHHLHHRAGSRSGGRAPDDHDFFESIIAALKGAQDWLVVGPGTAKTAFVAHVQERHPTEAPRIVDVETVDHPTDGELLRLARKRAVALDRMLPP